MFMEHLLVGHRLYTLSLNTQKSQQGRLVHYALYKKHRPSDLQSSPRPHNRERADVGLGASGAAVKGPATHHVMTGVGGGGLRGPGTSPAHSFTPSFPRLTRQPVLSYSAHSPLSGAPSLTHLLRPIQTSAGQQLDCTEAPCTPVSEVCSSTGPHTKPDGPKMETA